MVCIYIIFIYNNKCSNVLSVLNINKNKIYCNFYVI